MKNSKKEKGVTLIGVLIGVTILSIAMATQIRLLGDTIKREAELRKLIIATNIAREGVELAFAWRVSDGWDRLRLYKDKDLCGDISNLNLSSIKISTDTCLNSKLFYHNGMPGLYKYDIQKENYDDVPLWRIVNIKSCDGDDKDDSKCLVLVSTTGWEDCSASNWAICKSGTPQQCQCKLVSLSKQIYNWYIP